MSRARRLFPSLAVALGLVVAVGAGPPRADQPSRAGVEGRSGPDARSGADGGSGFNASSGGEPRSRADARIAGSAKLGPPSSASCAGCHAGEFQRWSRSHHALAMQPATAETVRGRFDGRSVKMPGAFARFFTHEGRFLVRTEGPNGTVADFPVALTIGVAPLQQYLIELPGGRLQSLTIAWDTTGRRWLPLYPGRRVPPGHPLHWTGRYQTWNLMCASCHTTGFEKRYEPDTDSYATRWSELGVGCAACHAVPPGHGSVGGGASPSVSSPAVTSSPAGPAGLAEARAQVDRCAPCHSLRTPIAESMVPGQPLLDGLRPELLHAGLYHSDGQQLGEVYEYGSFRQSKMYQRGVTCTDCHDAHRGGLRAVGDGVCTRCHSATPDQRFPTLAARRYDSPAHHFHRAASPGARCVSCHMPARNYMIVDARRDHAIRVPRPDLSLTLGTPNACTLCHVDRPARWAATAIVRWYGRRAPELHWATAVAAGREGKRDAASPLAALAADAGQPGIVRATAIDLLRSYAIAAVPAALATDPDPVVRLAFASGLEGLAPDRRLAVLAPLLSDPVRAVRIEAARALASVPAQHFGPGQRAAFDAALAECLAAERAMADSPAAHVNGGLLAADLGQRERASAEYATAVRMDPYLVPARIALASAHSSAGDNGTAERILREGIARLPGQGELHYSLGLVLAEEHRGPEAAAALGRAAALLPGRARVHYNHGLVLQGLGQRRAAEHALVTAARLDPDDPGVAHALAVFYVEERRWTRALSHAERFQELSPGDAGARDLVEQIRRELSPASKR